ncbi:MAG: methyltransferase domain-containing protein [Lachnospiraceae bacterium]|nr:methyltransferase domain-containing protein [Lachnospiraceae bacterium]
MGERNCPVCGESHSEVLQRIDMVIPEDYHLPNYYNVVVCSRCGMVYADTKATMEDYDWYYTHCNFYGDDSKDDNSYRYHMVKEILMQYCKKDFAMLDIGAGNGRFEIALKKHGYYTITGVDPSIESVRRLEDAGVRSYVWNIYSQILNGEEHKYDCIFLFEVAEHLLFPSSGIENVKRLLKEEGFFIISVPDYSKIGENTDYDVPNYFNLEHINYFSEISLDNLMNNYGMQKIACKNVGEDLIQCYKNGSSSVKLRKDNITRKAVSSYFHFQEGKKKKTARIIEKLKQTQEEVVIWGTGSYVMSLFAATELLDCRIIGFIDNNKIKQGREIYGYTIYTPEFLIGRKLTVLICSMLNSKDIQMQLEQMGTENGYIIL